MANGGIISVGQVDPGMRQDISERNQGIREDRDIRAQDARAAMQMASQERMSQLGIDAQRDVAGMQEQGLSNRAAMQESLGRDQLRQQKDEAQFERDFTEEQNLATFERTKRLREIEVEERIARQKGDEAIIKRLEDEKQVIGLQTRRADNFLDAVAASVIASEQEWARVHGQDEKERIMSEDRELADYQAKQAHIGIVTALVDTEWINDNTVNQLDFPPRISEDRWGNLISGGADNQSLDVDARVNRRLLEQMGKPITLEELEDVEGMREKIVNGEIGLGELATLKAILKQSRVSLAQKVQRVVIPVNKKVNAAQFSAVVSRAVAMGSVDRKTLPPGFDDTQWAALNQIVAFGNSAERIEKIEGLWNSKLKNDSAVKIMFKEADDMANGTGVTNLKLKYQEAALKHGLEQYEYDPEVFKAILRDLNPIFKELKESGLDTNVAQYLEQSLKDKETMYGIQGKARK